VEGDAILPYVRATTGAREPPVKGTPPAETHPLRSAMIAQLRRFNQDLTVVDDTLERLGARRRPWSNAIL
jgi:hypothetical protein